MAKCRQGGNMSHTKADLELWRHLYQAAIEFKKLAPWEWMLDSYMFGPQPEI
jgi:hypothetical protein